MGPFIRLGIVCAIATIACTHHDDVVSLDRCAELRDHLVDLRIGEATVGQNLSAAEIADHRASLSTALGEAFVQSCTQAYTAEQLRCALAALETDDATTCANTADSKEGR